MRLNVPWYGLLIVVDLIEQVSDCSEPANDIAQLVQGACCLLMLRLSLLKLLSVHYESPLHCNLSIVVQMTRCRVRSLSANL